MNSERPMTLKEWIPSLNARDRALVRAYVNEDRKKLRVQLDQLHLQQVRQLLTFSQDEMPVLMAAYRNAKKEYQDRLGVLGRSEKATRIKLEKIDELFSQCADKIKKEGADRAIDKSEHAVALDFFHQFVAREINELRDQLKKELT